MSVALAQIAKSEAANMVEKMRPRLALKQFPREGWGFPQIDQAIEHRERKAGIKSLLGTKGNFKRWHGIPTKGRA